MSEWQRRSLRDLTESVPAASPADHPDVPYAYIDISAVDNENHVIASPRTVLGRDAPRRARQAAREGDVLFSNVRTYLRNVAQVAGMPQPAVASTGFTLLRARPGTSARFLFHLVRSRYFLSLVAGSESGTHYPATSAAKVRSVEVLVPPLATQAAVAAALDCVQEAGRRVLAELASAQTEISGAVRSATLMAIDGTLTETWREARRPPATSLYPAVRLKDCIEGIRYGTSRRSQPDETGIPVLRMGNVQDGELDWSDLRYLRRDRVAPSLLLAEGDVLFNRTNSPELVGKTAVFRGARQATYASYLIRIKVRPGVLHPDWLSAWLNSPPGRQWAATVRTAGARQANISGAKLAELEFPLPAYQEQAEIVRRLRLIDGAAKAATARVETAAREVRGTVEALLDQAVSGPAYRSSRGYTMEQRSAPGTTAPGVERRNRRDALFMLPQAPHRHHRSLLHCLAWYRWPPGYLLGYSGGPPIPLPVALDYRCGATGHPVHLYRWSGGAEWRALAG